MPQLCHQVAFHTGRRARLVLGGDDGKAKLCGFGPVDQMAVRAELGCHAPAEGERSYRRAIEIFRSSGDTYEESRSLSNLGESRRGARDKAGARAA